MTPRVFLAWFWKIIGFLKNEKSRFWGSRKSKIHKIGFRSRNGSRTVRFNWKSVQRLKMTLRIFSKKSFSGEKFKNHGFSRSHWTNIEIILFFKSPFWECFWTILTFFPKSCQEWISKFILHVKIRPSWLQSTVWARSAIFEPFWGSNFWHFPDFSINSAHRSTDPLWLIPISEIK